MELFRRFANRQALIARGAVGYDSHTLILTELTDHLIQHFCPVCGELQQREAQAVSGVNSVRALGIGICHLITAS